MFAKKPAEKAVWKALAGVKAPQQDADIAASGMVKGLDINAKTGRVMFALEVDPAQGPALETLRQQAETAVKAVPGVKEVTAVLTAEQAPAPQQAPRPPRSKMPDPHGMEKNPKLSLPIKKIIAVASGKGGVGKSTVAVNIAAGLAAQGLSVGLLDADIYGPSVPRLTGVTSEKPQTDETGQLIPLQAHGLKLMSMGFMVEEEKAMIWRGPMVQTALYQMLRDVAWGTEDAPLDVLVVDMPPGTGDAQLTLAQKVPLSGAVIVSTPQDLALIDARRAIEMFKKVNVPILGLIENMSYYHCPECGHEDHLFGHGGAREEAEKRGVPFLGAVPLASAVRESSDRGMPLLAKGSPETDISRVYQEIITPLRQTLAEA